MKNILKIVITTCFVLLICGCSKNNKVSYTTFNEYFSKQNGYVMLDQTSNYGLDVRKCIEAGNGNVQVFYMEFESSEAAENYVKSMYKKESNYKVNKDYTYVKNTKGKYFKLYRKDNIIVYGSSIDKKYKKDIKSKLKDLGY